MSARLADLALLEDVLAGKLTDRQRSAFEEMRDGILEDEAHVRTLSPKQRAWVRRVLDVPTYENLVSSGRVERGAPVETPKVLQVLPLKPPHRRKEPAP